MNLHHSSSSCRTLPIALVASVVIGIGTALFATPTAHVGGDAAAANGGIAYTFFYVVNQSGRNVRVRVLADGDELFVDALESIRNPARQDREAPPPPSYPAHERKAPLNLKAQHLVVEELISGRRATYDIDPGPQPDAGFRIVIGPDTISIARDYVPIRAR